MVAVGAEDEEREAVFDDLSSVTDQSVLIPREEAAAESWEELRHVSLTHPSLPSLPHKMLVLLTLGSR